jgi:hypothetical protein
MCEEKPRVAHLIRAKPSYASYGVITERADTIQIAQAEFVVFELTWTGAGRRVGAAREPCQQDLLELRRMLPR